jgi:hypothetical protein
MNELQEVNFARVEAAVSGRDAPTGVDQESRGRPAGESFKTLHRIAGVARFLKLAEPAFKGGQNFFARKSRKKPIAFCEVRQSGALDWVDPPIGARDEGSDCGYGVQ